MLANIFKKTPKEAVKTGLYLALAGYATVSVFPLLREWEVFSMFPSKAYMEREAVISYEGMDGIVYDIFQNGQAPRTEMSKYSKGKMIIG